MTVIIHVYQKGRLHRWHCQWSLLGLHRFLFYMAICIHFIDSQHDRRLDGRQLFFIQIKHTFLYLSSKEFLQVVNIYRTWTTCALWRYHTQGLSVVLLKINNSCSDELHVNLVPLRPPLSPITTIHLEKTSSLFAKAVSYKNIKQWYTFVFAAQTTYVTNTNNDISCLHTKWRIEHHQPDNQEKFETPAAWNGQVNLYTVLFV